MSKDGQLCHACYFCGIEPSFFAGGPGRSEIIVDEQILKRARETALERPYVMALNKGSNNYSPHTALFINRGVIIVVPEAHKFPKEALSITGKKGLELIGERYKDVRSVARGLKLPMPANHTYLWY